MHAKNGPGRGDVGTWGCGGVGVWGVGMAMPSQLDIAKGTNVQSESRAKAMDIGSFSNF